MINNEKRSCKPQSIREILESMAAQKDGFFGALNHIVTHKSAKVYDENRRNWQCATAS